MVIIDDDFSSKFIKDKLSLVDPWYQLVIEMLCSNFRDLNGKIVIEVGCGLGGFLLNISKSCEEVVGLDVSSKAIHIAKDLAKKFGLQNRVNFIVGDAQFLPFKENGGDVLVCSETLEHVPDYEKAFSELVRVTKKSGYLCLTVPNFLSTAFFENMILLLIGQPGYVKSHVSVEKERIFHVFKLRKLLNQHKVEVIALRSVDFLHLPPRVRKLLKIEWPLQVISNRLENFFAKHFPPLRLAGANIGVLVKKLCLAH
ncbi:MAG: class I SAM-dependent methyltransferase [Candidatus Bathyarchaeia archaeon]